MKFRPIPMTALCLIALTGAARADTFDLDALIAAAQTEPPTSVLAVTGKIVQTAEAFSEKYGLDVTGRKVNEATQVDLLIREHQAGNVQSSVSLAADAAVIAAELLPQGIAESWTPGDIAPHLPGWARDPLVVVTDPQVWTYNSEAHDSCPVSNVWQLTEPAWQARVAVMDPLDKPIIADWFSQLEHSHDDAMKAAYQAHFGQPYTGETSATAAWVRAFAGNRPLISDSSGIADAVGAPGQEAPFFGMVSVAKFRDNTDKGYALAICEDMQPFSGWLYPGLGVIAAGTPSPATARLFLHYLMTEEGIATQSIDGKIPADPRVGLPAEEASGVAAHMDSLMVWNNAMAESDLQHRQDWQDLWQTSLSR